MQLRLITALTDEDYVTYSGWEKASLPRCPLHPRGGCGFARHGTYRRLTPLGTRIARWYCPTAHTTFSLLPDCLAARLPGSLKAIEEVVAAVERAPSLAAVANRLRLDIELPGALRWLRRRIQAVHSALALIRGLLPEPFAGCPPTVQAFRQRLCSQSVLVRLREIADAHLPHLPPPLGFRPPGKPAGEPHPARQQSTGADPPGGPA